MPSQALSFMLWALLTVRMTLPEGEGRERKGGAARGHWWVKAVAGQASAPLGASHTGAPQEGGCTLVLTIGSRTNAGGGAAQPGGGAGSGSKAGSGRHGAVWGDVSVCFSADRVFGAGYCLGW